MGIGARLSKRFNNSRFELSTNLAVENGSYFGLSGTDGVWFDGVNSIGSARLAMRHQLRGDLQFSVQFELGLAIGDPVGDGGDKGGSLISDAGEAHYS